MSQMTKTLLEMSELRSVPCNDRIELAPMVEEVLADLMPLAEARGIALERSGDAQLIGSDTLVYRLVFNLVENAIRYSRPDTAVRVSTCEEGGCVILRVEDSGPGIPEQFKESIFQPFFRVDSSRSREYGGVGLGLSLVWEIVALHGGTVEVEASSEDGTVMRVELPRRGGCYDRVMRRERTAAAPTAQGAQSPPLVWPGRDARSKPEFVVIRGSCATYFLLGRRGRARPSSRKPRAARLRLR